MNRGRLALVLTLLLAACQATPPAHVVRGDAAVVWAASVDEAREVAVAYEAFTGPAAAEMPGTEAGPVEIWVREGPIERIAGRLEDEQTPGMYADDRIHLRRYEVSDCCGANGWRMVLAHELVHHHLEIGPWERLPLPIEEGLCDAVAERMLARLGREQEAVDLRAARLVNLIVAIGALDFDLRVNGEKIHWLRTDVPARAPRADALAEKSTFLGFGVEDPTSQERAVAYVVARRILADQGWGFVARMAATAEQQGEDVEPLLFLAASGLFDDPQAWLAAAKEQFGPDEVRRSVECFTWLADWLALEWVHEPGRSLAWLADQQLELRWVHGEPDVWVDISDCSTFDDALRARDGGVIHLELE